MKVTLDVHEDKMDLLQWIVAEFELEQPTVPESEIVIPEWQKEHVRKRLAETKPEDYIPLEDFLTEWDGRAVVKS